MDPQKLTGFWKAESPFPRGPPFSGAKCYRFSGVCLHGNSRKQTGLAGTNNLWGGLGRHVAAPFTIARHPIDPTRSSQIMPDRAAIGMRTIVFCWYLQLFSKDLGKMEKHYDNMEYTYFVYFHKDMICIQCIYIYIHPHIFICIYIYMYRYTHINSTYDILTIIVLGWSQLASTSTRPLNSCWNATRAMMPDVGLWKVTCFKNFVNVRLNFLVLLMGDF